MNGKACCAGLRGLKVGLALSLMLATGCGAKGTINGKVTYLDKPVAGGVITFVSEKSGQPFNATINDDGNFTISKVPAGPVKIGVKPAEVPPMAGGPGGRGGPREGTKFRPEKDGPPTDIDPRKKNKEYVKIPDHYKDPDKSNLTYVVTSGTQEFNIPLK